MTNNDTLNFLRSLFTQIYELGERIYIFSDGNVRISLNNFLLGLALMTTVLISLVSLIRISGSSSADMVGKSVSGVRSRIQRRRGFESDDFGTSRGRWRGK